MAQSQPPVPHDDKAELLHVVGEGTIVVVVLVRVIVVVVVVVTVWAWAVIVLRTVLPDVLVTSRISARRVVVVVVELGTYVVSVSVDPTRRRVWAVVVDELVTVFVAMTVTVLVLVEVIRHEHAEEYNSGLPQTAA